VYDYRYRIHQRFNLEGDTKGVVSIDATNTSRNSTPPALDIDVLAKAELIGDDAVVHYRSRQSFMRLQITQLGQFVKAGHGNNSTSLETLWRPTRLIQAVIVRASSR
jgi:hypothetical protein